jgi:predicted nucleic acid-binding protein
MAVYWDTSCLLKLYCREPDSEMYLKLLEQDGEPPVTSSLATTELYFAFLQKQIRGETGSEKAGDLFGEFEEDMAQGLLFLIPVGEPLYRKSRELAGTCYFADPSVHLRSLDGLHLATALHAECRTVATTDQRMRAAARLMGISLLGEDD